MQSVKMNFPSGTNKSKSKATRSMGQFYQGEQALNPLVLPLSLIQNEVTDALSHRLFCRFKKKCMTCLSVNLWYCLIGQRGKSLKSMWLLNAEWVTTQKLNPYIRCPWGAKNKSLTRTYICEREDDQTILTIKQPHLLIVWWREGQRKPPEQDVTQPLHLHALLTQDGNVCIIEGKLTFMYDL